MAARNRLHPIVANRALRALRANPDDTTQGIVAIAAMTGNSNQRLFTRFKKSPKGAQNPAREARPLRRAVRPGADAGDA